jgi:hypothetical protein
MLEMGTYGSVGAPGEQFPGATRRAPGMARSALMALSTRERKRTGK